MLMSVMLPPLPALSVFTLTAPAPPKRRTSARRSPPVMLSPASASVLPSASAVPVAFNAPLRLPPSSVTAPKLFAVIGPLMLPPTPTLLSFTVIGPLLPFTSTLPVRLPPLMVSEVRPFTLPGAALLPMNPPRPPPVMLTGPMVAAVSWPLMLPAFTDALVILPATSMSPLMLPALSVTTPVLPALATSASSEPPRVIAPKFAAVHVPAFVPSFTVMGPALPVMSRSAFMAPSVVVSLPSDGAVMLASPMLAALMEAAGLPMLKSPSPMLRASSVNFVFVSAVPMLVMPGVPANTSAEIMSRTLTAPMKPLAKMPSTVRSLAFAVNAARSPVTLRSPMLTMPSPSGSLSKSGPSFARFTATVTFDFTVEPVRKS